MSADTHSSKVEPIGDKDESPNTKEFQEKYYPILPTAVNKYDVYSVCSTIDDEIAKVR